MTMNMISSTRLTPRCLIECGAFIFGGKVSSGDNNRRTLSPPCFANAGFCFHISIKNSLICSDCVSRASMTSSGIVSRMRLFISITRVFSTFDLLQRGYVELIFWPVRSPLHGEQIINRCNPDMLPKQLPRHRILHKLLEWHLWSHQNIHHPAADL